MFNCGLTLYSVSVRGAGATGAAGATAPLLFAHGGSGEGGGAALPFFLIAIELFYHPNNLRAMCEM